ncbi:alpha/beta hydrolase [Hydrogenimonas cancrithermarum]|uniref:Alpha/beta hydrolase n=1 Tax=Hydrogenimonas cancrithermarum TaxID=2993563 RepID=A0ABN6WWP3_9BACT|nr:alpha/beta fold hydrolase [Hydrogenimonas cancrithermarum]BDY12652.1 alpha/beta hydrolase [Hydrogenimonas cancrithermarum]
MMFLLVTVALFALLYPVWVVHRQTLGTHEPIVGNPGEWGTDYEDIAYETDDGILLKGWWIPAKSLKAVILLHGKGGSRNGYHSGVFDLGRRYHEAGWNVMMVDLRAHGESGGNRVTFGLKEHRDMLGWLDRIDASGLYSWRIHGFSMGAATALMMLECAPERFKSVVADASWIDFGRLARQELWRRAALPSFFYGYVERIAKTLFGQDFDFVDNRRRCEKMCGRNILYLFEKDDALLGTWHGEKLRSLCPDARIVWFEGTGHVEAFKTFPQRYMRIVSKW